MKRNPTIDRVAQAIIRAVRVTHGPEAAKAKLQDLSELFLDAQMTMLHPEIENGDRLPARTQMDVDILCVLSEMLDVATCDAEDAMRTPEAQPAPEGIS